MHRAARFALYCDTSASKLVVLWRGAGSREKRGQEMYGRWEDKGWEVAGSRRNWGKLCNIAQNFVIEKSAKRGEPTKIGREPGTGSEKLQLLVPPPPTIVKK